MIIDSVKFIDRNKKFFDKKRIEAINKALLFTGIEILARSIPFVPIDEGTLTGSGFVVVSSKKTYTPNSNLIRNKKNLLPFPEKFNTKNYSMRIGYATTYARRLHENEFEPGAKSKIKGLVTTYEYLKRVIRPKQDIDLFKKLLTRELNK